jgi:hypothetical protein
MPRARRLKARTWAMLYMNISPSFIIYMEECWDLEVRVSLDKGKCANYNNEC